MQCKHDGSRPALLYSTTSRDRCGHRSPATVYSISRSDSRQAIKQILTTILYLQISSITQNGLGCKYIVIAILERGFVLFKLSSGSSAVDTRRLSCDCPIYRQHKQYRHHGNDYFSPCNCSVELIIRKVSLVAFASCVTSTLIRLGGANVFDLS